MTEGQTGNSMGISYSHNMTTTPGHIKYRDLNIPVELYPLQKADIRP